MSECSEQGYTFDKKLGKNVCSKILKGKYNASVVDSRFCYINPKRFGQTFAYEREGKNRNGTIWMLEEAEVVFVNLTSYVYSPDKTYQYAAYLTS